MYGELYDYAMERDPEGFKYLLEKENIKSKQDMFDICMNPNNENKDMHTYGRIFGKYFLTNDMRKDLSLEERIAFQKTKENFFSKIIDNEKYTEFLKFTVIFFITGDLMKHILDSLRNTETQGVVNFLLILMRQ